jgi:uncharacterized membrane-anchored protein
MSGLQTIAEFMERRFQPAMRTLISTAERLESLLSEPYEPATYRGPKAILG